MKPIINVQFMRAVAALAVLVFHFSNQFIAAGGSTSHWFYYAFNQIGYAGVDFFFVISGYIMWITTQTITTEHPVLNFAYKRTTRIYFGYWPYFLLAIFIIALKPELLSEEVNLMGSWFLTELETSKLLIQVAWTLQYELYFYTLFALLLLLPRHLRLKSIAGLITIIIAYHLSMQTQNNVSALKDNSSWLNFLVSPFCLEFFAGCILAQFFQTHRIKYVAAVILTGLTALVVAIYLQEAVLGSSLISADHIYLRIIVFGTSAVFLLAAVIELEMRGRVLLARISTTLGGASYSIYLSHTIVIALVYSFGLENWILENSHSPGFWVLLLMVLTVGYSILHYIWIEQPLMSVAKSIHKRLFRTTQ